MSSVREILKNLMVRYNEHLPYMSSEDRAKLREDIKQAAVNAKRLKVLDKEVPSTSPSAEAEADGTQKLSPKFEEYRKKLEEINNQLDNPEPKGSGSLKEIKSRLNTLKKNLIVSLESNERNSKKQAEDDDDLVLASVKFEGVKYTTLNDDIEAVAGVIHSYEAVVEKYQAAEEEAANSTTKTVSQSFEWEVAVEEYQGPTLRKLERLTEKIKELQEKTSKEERVKKLQEKLESDEYEELEAVKIKFPIEVKKTVISSANGEKSITAEIKSPSIPFVSKAKETDEGGALTAQAEKPVTSGEDGKITKVTFAFSITRSATVMNELDLTAFFGETAESAAKATEKDTVGKIIIRSVSDFSKAIKSSKKEVGVPGETIKYSFSIELVGHSAKLVGSEPLTDGKVIREFEYQEVSPGKKFKYVVRTKPLATVIDKINAFLKES